LKFTENYQNFSWKGPKLTQFYLKIIRFLAKLLTFLKFWPQEEFEETFIETEGGDQRIAAAIADLYSANFRYNLRNWLESIEEYPRPFNMKFIALTDFFARLSDYFIDDECKAQCFAEENWSSLGLNYWSRPFC